MTVVLSLTNDCLVCIDNEPYIYLCWIFCENICQYILGEEFIDEWKHPETGAVTYYCSLCGCQFDNKLIVLHSKGEGHKQQYLVIVCYLLLTFMYMHVMSSGEQFWKFINVIYSTGEVKHMTVNVFVPSTDKCQNSFLNSCFAPLMSPISFHM